MILVTTGYFYEDSDLMHIKQLLLLLPYSTWLLKVKSPSPSLPGAFDTNKNIHQSCHEAHSIPVTFSMLFKRTLISMQHIPASHRPLISLPILLP